MQTIGGDLLFPVHSQEERVDTLARYQAAMAAYRARCESENYDASESSRVEAATDYENASAAAEAYFAGLPRLILSRCPHCDTPLIRPFDPVDFEGLYWRHDHVLDIPAPCRHFVALSGAVYAENENLVASQVFDIFPGPNRPFVMPRLLAYADGVAVISWLKMNNDAIAFPIAYFASQRPLPEALCVEWGRKERIYRTQLGEDGWHCRDEHRDFDLDDWLAEGEARFCDISDGSGSQFVTRVPDFDALKADVRLRKGGVRSLDSRPEEGEEDGRVEEEVDEYLPDASWDDDWGDATGLDGEEDWGNSTVFDDD